MDMLKLVAHIGMFLVSGFILCYDYFMNEIGSRGPWGRFKYFTFWNIIFQTVFFGLSILTDFIEPKSNPPHRSQRCLIQKVRDMFHSCIAFPSAMFVSVYFWTLYYIDRSLVWPVEFDAVLPNWHNRLLHSTALVFIMLDKLVVRHHYPPIPIGALCSGLVTAIYYSWVYYIFSTSQVWVYEILNVLDSQQRTAFVCLNFVSVAFFYLCGYWMTFYFWGPGPKYPRVEKTKGQ